MARLIEYRLKMSDVLRDASATYANRRDAMDRNYRAADGFMEAVTALYNMTVGRVVDKLHQGDRAGR